MVEQLVAFHHNEAFLLLSELPSLPNMKAHPLEPIYFLWQLLLDLQEKKTQVFVGPFSQHLQNFPAEDQWMHL